jgi:hypothetical protein
MTVIVPGPTENLETFPLGGRFRPSIVHFSRRVDEIKTFFHSVGLSVNSFRCVLFRTHIRLLTTTLHVCPKPLFHQAIANARQYDGSSSNGRTMDNSSILLKLRYHPQDPPLYALQRIWREEMAHPPSVLSLAQTPSGHTKRPIGVDRMIVCYRRPLNLGNLLSSRNFTFKNGPSISSRIAELET